MKKKELKNLYYELLYAVGNKHPGETRHMTALRYIQEAESFSTTGSRGTPGWPTEDFSAYDGN